MTVSRPLTAAVLALLLPLLGACDAASPEASLGDVPLPTIGLSGDGSDIRGSDGSTAVGAAEIGTVVMIGDSITKGAQDVLGEQFDALGLDVLIESENGKRIASSSTGNPSGASVAGSVAESGDGYHADEVWVVALGTNDIGQYSSDEEIAVAVEDVLAEVPADAALVWVDTWVVNRPEQSAALNSVIRQRVDARGNSIIAPWTFLAGEDDVLSGDGVHPTTDGAAVFAFIVTDTVRAFLGR